MTPVAVSHGLRLPLYDFGAGHPMTPVRYRLAVELLAAYGLLDREGVTVLDPRPATVDEITRVHPAPYVAAIRRFSDNPMLSQSWEVQQQWGITPPGGDTPAVPGLFDRAAAVCGVTMAPVLDVWEGRADRAIGVGGGLHHAFAGRAQGFCVFNDPAVAIQALLDAGAERVAFVDVDAHHGDGVQTIFYEDPRVLTVSIHEGPQTLFPGTGFATETGGPGAEGSAVNIALPPGTSDAGWLRAFHAVVPHVVRAFDPQVILSQHGCDSHMDDPLTNLMLSVDGQRASYLALEQLVEEVCGGRWVITGGGGYALTDVVPRIWTHLLAIVAGAPIDPETPTTPGWQAHVERLSGRLPPQRMTDGRVPRYRDWDLGYDPESWLDRCVQATRSASFPLLGIDQTV